jgi:hypothetical protein
MVRGAIPNTITSARTSVAHSIPPQIASVNVMAPCWNLLFVLQTLYKGFALGVEQVSFLVPS